MTKEEFFERWFDFVEVMKIGSSSRNLSSDARHKLHKWADWLADNKDLEKAVIRASQMEVSKATEELEKAWQLRESPLAKALR